MEEHNIPIDMVGGVSIGAFNGAVYCEELRAEDMEPRVFSWCQDMSSLWKKVMDITYPITAMFSGKYRAFNGAVYCEELRAENMDLGFSVGAKTFHHYGGRSWTLHTQSQPCSQVSIGHLMGQSIVKNSGHKIWNLGFSVGVKTCHHYGRKLWT